MKSIAERFENKYQPVPWSGCWLWTAAIDDSGYGEIKAPTEFGNRKFKAHRVSYEIHKGEITMQFVVDHICRVPACVNPDHLRAITKIENTMIGFGYMAINARRDNCNHGHEFTKENTIFKDSKRRRCKTCKNETEKLRKRNMRGTDKQ